MKTLLKHWRKVVEFLNVISEGIDKTQYKNGWGKL
jgi:hypothetical protein